MNPDEKSDVSLLIDVLKVQPTHTGCSPCKESMQLRTGRRFVKESGRIEENRDVMATEGLVYIYIITTGILLLPKSVTIPSHLNQIIHSRYILFTTLLLFSGESS